MLYSYIFILNKQTKRIVYDISYSPLTLRPSSDVVTFISLNCVQCRIYNVMIDEISEVKYTYDDPFQQVCK